MKLFAHPLQLRLQFCVCVFQFDVLELDCHFLLRDLLRHGEHLVDFSLVPIDGDAVCVVFFGPHHATTVLLLHHFKVTFPVLPELFLQGGDGLVEL